MSTTSSSDQLPPRVPPFAPIPGTMPPGSGSGGGANPGPNMTLAGGNVQIPGMISPATLEHYRLTQLYQYAMAAERLRCPPGNFMPGMPPGMRPELAPFLYGPYYGRLIARPPEEPKPQHSYIGLIAMAILSHPDKKLVLSDIYQYILDNFPYFRARGPGWRNSIRHNLSLNDCFVKAGRSANGKGHYWAVHAANVDDFSKGDFRRRRAQRKVRKHMGLAVDDDDSPSPPPSSPPPVWHNPHHPLNHGGHLGGPLGAPQPHGFDIPATLFGLSAAAAAANLGQKNPPGHAHPHHHHSESLHNQLQSVNQSLNLLNRKRQFDVASLLAPEKDSNARKLLSPSSCKSDENEREQSLSSPSPPPTLLKRMNVMVKKDPNESSDSEHSDNEDIEVTEEDTPKKEVVLSEGIKKKKGSESGENEKDREDESDHYESPRKQRRISLGQDGNSRSSDEDRERPTRSSISQSSNSQNFERFHGQSQLNQESFPQSNLPHGGLSPLEIIQAQHFIQQHQHHGQGGIHHNPNSLTHSHSHAPNPNFPFGQNLIQQNPSLASLMILSSKYKELQSSMIMASRRSPQ